MPEIRRTAPPEHETGLKDWDKTVGPRDSHRIGDGKFRPKGSPVYQIDLDDMQKRIDKHIMHMMLVSGCIGLHVGLHRVRHHRADHMSERLNGLRQGVVALCISHRPHRRTLRMKVWSWRSASST